MLEAAETGQSLERAIYDQQEPELRTRLVHMQLDLKAASFPVMVIVSGDDGVGVRAVVDLLSNWMDPRFVATNVYAEPSEEERMHPASWRYWTTLAPNGRVGVYANDWSTRALSLRADGVVTAREFNEALDTIERFERMLAVDGAVVLKLYLHKPQEELAGDQKRLKRMAEGSGSAKIGLAMLKHPRRTRDLVEQVLQKTGTGLCPWHIIESTSPEYRDVTVAKLLLDTVGARLAPDAPKKPLVVASIPPSRPEGKSVLDSVDLAARLTDEEYDQEMRDLRSQIRKLIAKGHRNGLSTVAAFEGWDAAGKGGTIRRLVQCMSPEMYRIVPIAAPNDVERAHHYLWRFWKQIPRDGEFVVFDRTWYGRVLVERVEGFASDSEWQRAYSEINYFEDRLIQHGTVVMKFWLHMDKEEQLRRFKEREEIAFKQYKIGPEDYRNREKWDQYVTAVDDMVARTSTVHAPWHLIASNDKKFARIQVLRVVAETLASHV